MSVQEKTGQKQVTQDKYRNVAIIAHVDHGKTSLVDSFLKQTKVFRDNQEEMNQDMILDSGDLEREKGITIKAKNIAVRYNGYKINIIDTPGHADFGGEVERTLHMADGCILLIDAQEGPMPQTKFVLKKALELGFVPIVVINKIDKSFADPAKALDKVTDLLLTLATDEKQLDFPVLYAIGRDGLAFKTLPEGDLSTGNIKGDITPLLDAIIEYIPSPKGHQQKPFQMQITTLHYDPHVGRYLIGKIKRGQVKIGDSVVIVDSDKTDAEQMKGKIKKILVREGLDFVEVNSAFAGEIIAIGGIEYKTIGGTICDPAKIDPLPTIKISEPSIKIKFETNTSPFLGQEGKFVSVGLLEARLEKESETNISLKIEKLGSGGYYVSGRGELQLTILIEEMRREGFEFQIKKPEVIIKEIDGEQFEPMEEVFIEVPTEFQGVVVSELNERRATMKDLQVDDHANVARMEYHILTRKLLGLRSTLLSLTRGNLIMNNTLVDYVKYIKQNEMYRKGVLVSMAQGQAMDYALNMIQERGEIIVEPGAKVYSGMIMGINKYETDMEVNPCKGRLKTSVRRDKAEITQISLKNIKPLSLEFAITFLGSDEILEITPQNLRLRKIHLNPSDRAKFARQKKAS